MARFIRSFAAFFFWSAPILGVPVTYEFSGNLEEDLGTLSASTPFSGSFTYEFPQAPFSVDESISRYTYDTFTLTIGTDTLTFLGFSNGDIRVRDTDLFLFTVEQAPGGGPLGVIGGVELRTIEILLFDQERMAFETQELPGPTMTLEEFEASHLGFLGRTNPQESSSTVTARGQLTSLGSVTASTTESIPTLSEWGLLSLAALLSLAGSLLLRRWSVPIG